ncbi:DUF7687 domain-containing protein [Polaribacter atrinae]|uniref:Uncharacterized protein n=1 Tax=Polaribacter atrinae TaxID=1333662 RepID=A0A176TEM3_9FLAO|nr:hypothetical protein [Polaribacter atrinae]OAD45993.1 hypothetical protein LPB303_04495 [Polaribacter atrinae]
MKANNKFENLDLEFWANIKLLNQRLGYTIRKTKKNPEGGFVVPSVEDIKRVFSEEGLSTKRLIEKDNLTDFGKLVVEYMEFRGDILTNIVQPNLMNKDQAKKLFYEMKKANKPKCPLPMNKQKDEKRDHSFLTGLVNMIVEKNKGELECDYDPKELTAITKDGFPIRTLSRRVDGAFPSVIDPKAIWEIKEYYYTTTFGSRVADGVYETQLDGWELWETKENTGIEVKHYLFVDDHFTWWIKGRSYLCRLIDTIHMGLVTEVIFGKEVVTRLPEIVKSWAIDE